MISSQDEQRMDRIHPLDAKHALENLQQALKTVESNIRTSLSDVQSLKDGHYHQAEQLHRRLVGQTTLMMTTSNGNILCITGPLLGEFTIHWWIPLTKADVELWCFLWSASEQSGEQTIKTPVIWDAFLPILVSLYCQQALSTMFYVVIWGDVTCYAILMT